MGLQFGGLPEHSIAIITKGRLKGMKFTVKSTPKAFNPLEFSPPNASRFESGRSNQLMNINDVCLSESFSLRISLRASLGYNRQLNCFLVCKN